MELAPGTILLGKYRIDEIIGTGGMGNVVRASHLYLHQSVAIKVLLPQMAESDSTKQRFLREAQATVRLKSEHIARVMDVGTVEGVPFMVMEFLEGNDLNQILRHHGPQIPSIVVDLMLQACEGIAEAHALGIIHRDVKPSNFFITRRPDGSMLLKILDFGISKAPVGYDELTGTQTVIGTPTYMAPEQMKSGKSADPRSDIWSIGVVMYQLITGQPPFSGESYADLVIKVGFEAPAPIPVPLPAGLPEVILRCLEKDPNLRHQNVGELARMLAPFATDPVSAAQSASRAVRILQHRGAPTGSPLSAAGGLLTPPPISPAQLTPRSWPPSQGTSLSHGAGQVTVRGRGRRGWLVAGVASLCVLAGLGGYAISQASHAEGASSTASQPSLVPAAAAPPSPPPSSLTTPAPAAPGVAAPAVAAPTAQAATSGEPGADRPPVVDDPARAGSGSGHAAETPATGDPDHRAKPSRPASDETSRPRPPARSPAKPPRPKKPDDDLFGSRH
ncbi:MAG TPA: serine/threonine-protein kinase [Kofleriaceae bacterium]|nr:serine/threonine-protein kinase [Kofleriaceae bacterium]